MQYKKLLPATVATALLAGASINAMAEPEISANVSLVSDYRFRGISQSNSDPAIQGGFDLEFENGIYVGTWGSSVDFGGNYGSLELDGYIGWAMETEQGVEFDVGYIYYGYPGDHDVPEDGDYQEFYGSVSFDGITGGIAYSDDFYASTGQYFYYYAEYSLDLTRVGLPEGWALDFHAGYSDFEDKEFLSNNKDSYVDYSVTLSASYFALDWSVAWVGNDLDKEDYWDANGLVDDTVVFSVSKSF